MKVGLGKFLRGESAVTTSSQIVNFSWLTRQGVALFERDSDGDATPGLAPVSLDRAAGHRARVVRVRPPRFERRRRLRDVHQAVPARRERVGNAMRDEGA